MSAVMWYFIDVTGAQVGPVDAAGVRSALHGHSASTSSLTWREGLVGWVPMSQLSGELGLSIGAPAAALPPAWNAGPASTPGVGSVDAVVPAGFVRRFAALFLDQLILAIPMSVAFGVFWAVALGATPDATTAIAAQGMFYLVYLLVAVLYYAGMESSAGQATLGKRALGIKVCDMDGRRIGFGRAVGRWFAASLSYLTLYIGFLMAAFTERKRALHDFVAATQVVDKWAYTASPERQQRSLSGCLIVFLVGSLFCLVLVPIMAAIAISQYQDYVIRSQVSEASSLADGVKTAMREYVENRGEWPQANADAGLVEAAEITGLYVEYVDIGQQPGRIEAGFSAQSPHRANEALSGKHLYFDGKVEDGRLIWSCSSDDLKQKWCPSSCSCTG